MQRHPVASLLLLAAVIAGALAAMHPALAQGQQASLDVRNASLVIRVYPDGAVKPVYSLDAVLRLPPGVLGGSVDLDASYSSEYAQGHRSRSLDAALSLVSPGSGGENGRLKLDLLASLSRHGTETRAWVSARVVAGNDTYTAVVEVPNATLSMAGAGPARFRALVRFAGDIARDAEAPVLNATPAVLNEWLAMHGLGFVHVEKVAPRKAGGAVEMYVEGTLDVDAMLREAVANGMPPADAGKLKALLSEPLDVSVGMSLSLDMASSGDRFGLHVKYSDDERGDLERADRLAREAAPLVSELFSALGGKVAESAGNQRAEGIATLLRTARGGAEEASLPLVEAPPTKSRVEVHVHGGNESLAIGVLYEGPRLRLSPGTGSPSEDAEKALTLLSAKLAELRSGLLQVSAFLPGADRAMPAEARVEPATPGVRVSRTLVPLAELASVNVEAGKAAGATTAPQGPAKTTRPQTGTAGHPAGASSRGTTTAAGHAPATRAPEPTATGHTGGGARSAAYYAVAATAVAVLAAALAVARRRASR